MENLKAVAELKARQKLYVDLQNTVKKSAQAMSIDRKSSSILVPVSCPDLGVRSSILKLDKNARVKSIFHHFAKKIRNFNPNDYYLQKEYAMLKSTIDDLPIKFTRIPIPPSIKVDQLYNSIIIMKKKEFANEILEDQNTLMRNQSKLSIIKGYDQASFSGQMAPLLEISSDYRSLTAAKVYEVFLTHPDFQSKTTRPDLPEDELLAGHRFR